MNDVQLTRGSVEPESHVAPEPAHTSSNLDRLEKKKNREKRRRSEVNDRFDELIEVMEDAQSQLMNATSSANDFSKGTLTKAGLLEKAVDLVKLLADENKKLKMMIHAPPQPVPMMPAFDPNLAQNWVLCPRVMPYGGPMMQPPADIGSMINYQSFVGNAQMPMALSLPPPACPVGYNGTKASVLTYADMLQLGDWTQTPAPKFYPMSNYCGNESKVPTSHEVSKVSEVSTHAECA